jgi:hypothetical protein
LADRIPKPLPHQREWLRSGARFKLARAGRRGGKSRGSLYAAICGHGPLIDGKAFEHMQAALDAAAESEGIAPDRLKSARAHVLTSEDPAEVRHRLSATYDDFGWRAAA